VFSIADIACYGYAQSHWWAGVDISGLPDLAAWLRRLAERPSAHAGLEVPAGKVNIMVDEAGESKQKRSRVEQNAAAAGRPFFGWRDLLEVNSEDSMALGGALRPAAGGAPAAGPQLPVKCYVLRYVYVEDVLERRAPHRAAHLALAKAYSDRGEIIAGGALDPPTAAYIIFRVDSRAKVEEFVQADPYVKNGIVVSHEIHDWNVMVGSAL